MASSRREAALARRALKQAVEARRGGDEAGALAFELVLEMLRRSIAGDHADVEEAGG